MLMEVVKVQARARSGPPEVFRAYLLQGEHWRTGRRIKNDATTVDDAGNPPRAHGAAVFKGEQLVDLARPQVLAPHFVDHLDQVWVESLVDTAARTVIQRYYRVESSMRDVAKHRPEEVEALRYFILPLGRRPELRVAMREHDVTERGLYGRRDRAVVLVWEDLGGRW